MIIKKLVIWLAGLAGVTAAGAAAALYWFIVVNPADDIGPEHLKKLLGVESPVYFQDGQNKVGVIFEDSHRQYVPYAKIPQGFVQAIVAAEDHAFFHHHGVDIPGILRAMIANIQAGRVVQGGSTLTQQAAKNLFKREGRSFREKLKELVYALRLEAHYSKENILEFYVNQFYVSGNGLGLGVAAKYYFDKAPEELSLIENAFIAGSVKRPNYYNPFIKRDEASAKAARARAKERTRYVLGQMRDMGMINDQTYQALSAQEIPFKQGKTTFADNTIMDVVREALAEPEVEEALAAHGIDTVASSGIRIITTVDKAFQSDGFNATRQELSRLSVRLVGYDQRALQAPYRKLAEEKTPIETGSFLFGTIRKVAKGKAPEIEVALGKASDNGVLAEVTGVIDRDGLMPMTEAQAKYDGQRWSSADRQQLDRLVDTMQPGDLVYVSLREYDGAAKRYWLDLQRYPEVQGALIAVQEGRIKAMIGGSENRFYNRAMEAKRVMGSVVKPLVYSAALQLGWNAADMLDNRRAGFVYQGQEYFPRPDHISPYPWVSISWAGTKSENLASVWLLYHLCDRLSPSQFKMVIAKLGLGREPNESYQQYAARIRDRYGILITGQVLRRLAFDRAVDMIGPDLLFDGKSAENELLHQFNYQLAGTVAADDKASEKEVRRQAVARTFVDQQRYYRQLLAYKIKVESGGGGDLSSSSPDPAAEGQASAYLFAGPAGYLFAESPPSGEWHLMTPEEVMSAWQGQPAGAQGFWDQISLNGLLTAGTFRQLTELVGQEYQRISALPPYDPEVLHQVRDFRVLAGLRYLIALVREMGISSPLDPVLSFPLGSNVISLIEVARAYETLVTGLNYRVGRPDADESLMIIERIEDSDGHEIYRPERGGKRILDPNTALSLSDILKNVVKYGTGRYARSRIRLQSEDPKRRALLEDMDLEVPVLGKTGTANDFRNSAFAGYVPGVATDGSGLTLDGGYALAVYEGFDDNVSMTRTSSHVTGSSGALVLWSEMADAIVNDKGYGDQLQLETLPFAADIEIPLQYPELGQIVADQATVVTVGSQVGDPAVLVPSGGKSQLQLGPSVVTFGKIQGAGELIPARAVKPFWEEK